MDDFQSQIKARILNLPIKKLALFCTLNCEKMIPAYLIFSEKHQWGDVAFFQNWIEDLYLETIMANSFIDINRKDGLEANFPNLDEFTGISASYAFDMCCSFGELNEFIATGDKTHAMNNAQQCINTVDMFVQQKEGISYVSFDDIAKLEQLIIKDGYMQKEFGRQLAILAEVENVDIIDDGAVALLRNLNASFGPLIDYGLLG